MSSATWSQSTAKAIVCPAVEAPELNPPTQQNKSTTITRVIGPLGGGNVASTSRVCRQRPATHALFDGFVVGERVRFTFATNSFPSSVSILDWLHGFIRYPYNRICAKEPYTVHTRSPQFLASSRHARCFDRLFPRLVPPRPSQLNALRPECQHCRSLERRAGVPKRGWRAFGV